MRKITFLKSLLLLCALMAGVGSAWGQSLTVDFESEASAYTDWTFTTITTQQTNSTVSAHGGSYFGATDGKTKGSIVTKSKIASPNSIVFYISKLSTNNTASSWYVKVSDDGETWDNVGEAQSASSGITRGTWTEVSRDLTSYSNVYVGVFYDGTTAQRCIDDIKLTYTDNTKTNVTLSFPKNSYVADVATGANSFSAPTVTATPSVTGIIYMSSNTDVATVDENTGAVTLVKKGTTQITASFPGDDTYNSAEASYTLTVNNSNANDGSESKPFTVEEAIDFITAKEYGEGNYYVKGIISKISSSSVSSGTLTYYISDDGTTTNQLQVFKGKNLENADFTNVSDIEEGDAVVVVGPLLYYNDKTPEIKDGNYIYSLTRKKDLTLVVENVEMFVEQEKAVGDLYLVDDDYDGEISFSSSAEAVAKVEGSVLKALTVGTATITVTAAASSKYKGTEETFTVTVKSRDVKPEGFAGGGKYVLLTDALTLAEGDKLIVVCESKSMAMGAQSGTKCDNIVVTISDHAITELPSGVKEVTLESATGGWYLKTDQGYLTSTSAKSIKVEAKTDDASVVTIGIDTDNNAKIDFGDAGTLQYNASSPRFCTYTSDQTAVQIYRYTETTTFDVEMGAAGWRTLVSAQDVTLPEGLTAYVVTANDGGSATLATAGSVKANTPYILEGDEGTYTLTVALGVTAPASNLLQISTESTGNGVYVLYNGTQGVGFYKWYGGSLGAGRVYLPATAGAPDFIGFGDETTGIDTVQSSGIKVQDSEIYNLAGQRVARPTKGLYIVNGKKVVIR